MGLTGDFARARSEGYSIFRSIDLDQTEEQVKDGPGVVAWVRMHNLAASKVYVKFYDALASSVTVGSTTPVLTIPMEANSGEVWSVPLGFATAITVAATTGVADNDTGAPGANEVVVNIGYA